MATKLKKTVVRETSRPHDYHGKSLVVSLEVGDIIGIREKSSRRKFECPLSEIYRYMVARQAQGTKKKRMIHQVRRGILTR